MTKDVLDYFKTICSIPHPSGHEELLGNYIEVNMHKIMNLIMLEMK